MRGGGPAVCAAIVISYLSEFTRTRRCVNPYLAIDWWILGYSALGEGTALRSRCANDQVRRAPARARSPHPKIHDSGRWRWRAGMDCKLRIGVRSPRLRRSGVAGGAMRQLVKQLSRGSAILACIAGEFGITARLRMRRRSRLRAGARRCHANVARILSGIPRAPLLTQHGYATTPLTLSQ